jgi:hypothetical protein
MSTEECQRQAQTYWRAAAAMPIHIYCINQLAKRA